MNQAVFYKKPSIIAAGQLKSWRNICEEKAIPPTGAHSYSGGWHIPADTSERYQELESCWPASSATTAFLDDVVFLARCQFDFLSVPHPPWAWILALLWKLKLALATHTPMNVWVTSASVHPDCTFHTQPSKGHRFTHTWQLWTQSWELFNNSQ